MKCIQRKTLRNYIKNIVNKYMFIKLIIDKTKKYLYNHIVTKNYVKK